MAFNMPRLKEEWREMIIWRINGDEIGPHGNGAMFFATKAEANKALSEYRIGRLEDMGTGPEKITVKNRDQLADALNDAMGWGAS